MPSDRRRNRDNEFDDRPVRRPRHDPYDERDDYADGPSGGPRRRPAGKGMNIPGLIGMILGLVGLVISLFPCIGWMFGGPLAAIGLVLGIVGLFTGRQTTGRGFPIAATIISVAALLVGGGWFLVARHMTNTAQKKLEDERVAWEQQVKAAQA